MNDIEQRLVASAIEEWAISHSASIALEFLPYVDPAEYMHLLPPEMKVALWNYEWIHSPPATLDDFWLLDTSLYSAKFFEGLTEAQAEEKIRESNLIDKQRKYDRFWAMHEYFKRAA